MKPVLRRSIDERGNGLVGTALGCAVFVAFLLLAIQAILGLYATSVITAVTTDAATRVANSAGDPGARVAAEAEARRMLGRAGEGATFEWATSSNDGWLGGPPSSRNGTLGSSATVDSSATTDDSVALTVSVALPKFFRGFAPGGEVGRISRTARVAIEQFR